MSQSTTQEFGKWRSRLWPVHSYELKKLLPMFFMFFCISFNYTILRDAKDGLVVTGAGAEAIPFLKFWGVVPCAILFTVVYAKLSNVLSREKLFYTALTPFLVFFAAFAVVIFPNREALQPNALCDYLATVMPSGLKGLVECIRTWPFAIFYILAELWGSVVLSLLFWSFANEITRVTEAKRFYSLFGLGANLALICSGPYIIWCTSLRESAAARGWNAEQLSISLLMGAVVFMGFGVMAFYNHINRKVLTDKRFYDPEESAGNKKSKKKKPKLSIGESVRFLFQSKYLGCICLLVMSYGVAINLVEVTWKNQLKLQYPNIVEYTKFMGGFSTVTGFVTTLMIIFVGGNAIRRGWGFAALITPLVLMITGAGFFSFVLFQDVFAGMLAWIGTTPLYMAVMFGAAQNVMSKSSKYSLFDPTKEMAYIPLDAESKVKGKAAIDVVGARLGKSGGSLIQQFLLVVLGSVAAMAPYVAILMCIVVGGWMLAVRSLNKQFLTLTAETEAEKARVASEEAAQEETAEAAPAAG